MIIFPIVSEYSEEFPTLIIIKRQIVQNKLPNSLIENENPWEQDTNNNDALQELFTIVTNFEIYYSYKL